MAYLGWVPTKRSSGPSVRRGGITKAGNHHARRLLGRRRVSVLEDSTDRAADALPTRSVARADLCDCVKGAVASEAQLRLTSRFRRDTATFVRPRRFWGEYQEAHTSARRSRDWNGGASHRISETGISRGSFFRPRSRGLVHSADAAQGDPGDRLEGVPREGPHGESECPARDPPAAQPDAGDSEPAAGNVSPAIEPGADRSPKNAPRRMKGLATH